MASHAAVSREFLQSMPETPVGMALNSTASHTGALWEQVAPQGSQLLTSW